MSEHFIELGEIRKDKRKQKRRELVARLKGGFKHIARKTGPVVRKFAQSTRRGMIKAGPVVGKFARATARGAVKTGRGLRKGAIALNKAGVALNKRQQAASKGSGSDGPFGNLDLGFSTPPKKKGKKAQDDFNIFGGL